MIRLGKLTDYGLVLMTFMARNQNRSLHTACSLVQESRLPLPTVSKLLKVLQRAGLLVSQRGVNGGYKLARSPREISVAEIIAVFEGPVALTECSTEISGICNLEPCCPIRNNQRIISEVVRGALGAVMLADLLQPLHVVTIKRPDGRPAAPAIGLASSMDGLSRRVQ